jgi:transcriptional regulator with XRE-family HTH domain
VFTNLVRRVPFAHDTRTVPPVRTDAEHFVTSTLGRRLFVARLELCYKLGRSVTLTEFGRLIAERMGRREPFSYAAVSRWEAGLQAPALEVIEAIAELSGVDPGWISHGEKSAAPSPGRSAATPTRGAEQIPPAMFTPVGRTTAPARGRRKKPRD